jgi:predicted RNA-binding Zn-ribbon protein involved in translation (DUF1610 family)
MAEQITEIKQRLRKRIATGGRFLCPRCGASHSRGALDGCAVYRCLRCGYVGHGYHPDPEPDRGTYEDSLHAEACDVRAGLSEWTGAPRMPQETGEAPI